MAEASIDRVLNCPNLPSLPAAAMEVLELTRDPKVTLERIAAAIQMDPALAAKVLRTVNSSYYGLSKPCSTISRAISYLGLNTVKSVVLGFSLVDSARRSAAGGGFDLAAYWRASVYSAAAARLIAESVRDVDRDEAFLAALVQDIGMLAAFTALRETYTAVLQKACGRHDRLAAAEREALGFTHAEAGALLAEKWRLPEQIVSCIRCHHAPDQAPPSSLTLTRAVALAGVIAGVLEATDRAANARRAAALAERWFSLRPEETLGLVERAIERGHELSRAMEVKTGEAPDVDAIMAQANEAMLAHQVEMVREADTLRQTSEDLARQTVTDPLTGVFNRKRFDAEVERLFAEATGARSSLAVLFIDADRFKSVNDAHGHRAGDAVLVELANRLRRAAGESGVVCRYGGEEFAVLLPGRDGRGAAEVAERARAAMESAPVDIRGTGAAVGSIPVTISVGVAALRDGAGLAAAGDLVKAADDAVYAAKRSGRNRVCVHAPGQALASPAAPAPARPEAPAAPPPATTPALTVLLVEDDPLARHVVEVLLVRRKGARVLHAGTLDRAIEAMRAPAVARPDLIISELVVPGGSAEDLLAAARTTAALAGVPIVVLSRSDQPAAKERCLAAGARAVVLKAEMLRDMDGWINRMVALVAAAPPAGAAAA